MPRHLAPLALLAALIGPARGDDQPASPPDAPVSFDRQVLPTLQRKCQGCHQPAKAGGKLDLTTFEALGRGGASGPAFETGRPGEGSLLVENVTGKPPAMPPNGSPLGAGCHGFGHPTPCAPGRINTDAAPGRRPGAASRVNQLFKMGELDSVATGCPQPVRLGRAHGSRVEDNPWHPGPDDTA